MICNRQQALDSRFYTYLWLRRDGTPYYVGKGKGQRGYQHHKAQHKHRPESAARIFVQYWASSEEAAEKEIWYIRLFGRKDIGTGILHNQTNGGDGRSHYKHKPETIEKLRATNAKPELLALRKNFRHTPEQRAKQVTAQLGKPGGMLGKKHSEGTKSKMSDAQKIRKGRNIETIRAIGYANKGKIHSEETRKRMSDGQKRRHTKAATA